jgi:capsular exopolysaccharide synthesis family protein
MLPPESKKLPPAKAVPDPAHDHAPAPQAVGYADPEAQLTAGPPPGLSSAPTLGTLVHAFRRRWTMAVPVALGGALAACAIAWVVMPAEYTSIIVFRILSRPPQGSLENEENFTNVQKAQVAFMKSHDVLVEAIEKARTAELYGETFRAEKLPKKLTATFNEGPEMCALSLSGESPEAVAALLNALGEVYPGRIAANDEARVKSRIAQLRRRLYQDPDNRVGRQSTLAEQLRDKRVELAKAEKDAGILDAPALARSLDDARAQLEGVRRDQRQAKQALGGLMSSLAAKQKRVSSPPGVEVPDKEAAEGLRDDPEYQEVMQDVARLRKIIEGYGKANLSNERVRTALETKQAEVKKRDGERRALLDEKKRQLGRERQRQLLADDRKAIVDLEDKIEEARSLEKSLEGDERRWAAKVEGFRAGGPKPSPEVEALRDQVRQLEKEVGRVGDDLAALEGSLPITPRVSVHTEAFVPTERDLTKPLKVCLASGFGAFGLLLLGVCLLETRGRRIYAADDVTSGLGLRVIGTLPWLPAAARQHAAVAQSLAGLDSKLGMAEAVDAVRTVLLHAPRVDGARVIMISSASGGEGKTTLASHLAASLARAWRKTLLIDGDLRNPAQHTQFDQLLEPGLSEALRGEVEIDDAIKPTAVSRLWLMPAGKVDGHSLQALAQDGVGDLFEHLKEQYDFIVLDTSPVLPVPDALLLGKHADAVLLSVMRDVSRIPTVYGAQQRLEALGIRVLGAVVLGEKAEGYGRAVPYPRPA